MQSSHCRFFQQYVLTVGPSFMVRLEFSHSLRHSRWMWLIVPAHLHGDISGSTPIFSSPKQILQTFPSIILAFFSSSYLNFSFCMFLFNLFLCFLYAFPSIREDALSLSCSGSAIVFSLLLSPWFIGEVNLLS